MKTSDLISNDPQATFIALTLLQKDPHFFKYIRRYYREDLLDLHNILDNLDTVKITRWSISRKPSLTIFPISVLKNIVEDYETNRIDSNERS